MANHKGHKPYGNQAGSVTRLPAVTPIERAAWARARAAEARRRALDAPEDRVLALAAESREREYRELLALFDLDPRLVAQVEGRQAELTNWRDCQTTVGVHAATAGVTRPPKRNPRRRSA